MDNVTTLENGMGPQEIDAALDELEVLAASAQATVQEMQEDDKEALQNLEAISNSVDGIAKNLERSQLEMDAIDRKAEDEIDGDVLEQVTDLTGE